MYRSFTLKNFRCFQHLTVEPLERITLIAGKNNVGKTAFLEGLFIHLGPNHPQHPLRLNVLRGIEQVDVSAEEAWRWLFFNSDVGQTIELKSLDSNGVKRALQLNLVKPKMMTYSAANGSTLSTSETWQGLNLAYQDSTGQKGTSQALLEAGQFKMQPAHLTSLTPAVFLSTPTPPQEDAKRFSQLEAVNRQHELLPVLRHLEPRLQRLAVLFNGPTPQIHADLGLGRLLPFGLLGEGARRLLSLLLIIATTPNGIVLIDEMENGLHHSVLVEVWRGIAQAARQVNVQLIVTTHSYESIHAAHQAFAENPNYDFQLHRLERQEKAEHYAEKQKRGRKSAKKGHREINVAGGRGRRGGEGTRGRGGEGAVKVPRSSGGGKGQGLWSFFWPTHPTIHRYLRWNRRAIPQRAFFTLEVSSVNKGIGPRSATR